MQEELFNLENGIYEMSGIDTYTNTENGANGYLIELNDNTYFFEEDPSDGYRSWVFGGIDNLKKCKYKFPKQKVKVNIVVDLELSFEGIHIVDTTSELPILKIGTLYFTDYYPMASMEYYPENFSINQENKKYNTWIDCTEDNYWQSDYDVVAYLIENGSHRETRIMSKRECMYGWSTLVKYGAKFMTPSNPFKTFV